MNSNGAFWELGTGSMCFREENKFRRARFVHLRYRPRLQGLGFFPSCHVQHHPLVAMLSERSFNGVYVRLTPPMGRASRLLEYNGYKWVHVAPIHDERSLCSLHKRPEHCPKDQRVIVVCITHCPSPWPVLPTSGIPVMWWRIERCLGCFFSFWP